MIVGPIAQEVCDLVRGSTPAVIEVAFDGVPDDVIVMGDPTRLHQLLMNLCTNAVQAMGEGGTLKLEVHTEVLESPLKVRSGEVPPGEYVRIAVSDTGHGIAPEVIDRIFEPFFTTKPAGRGTGLGLALVHSVVSEHRLSSRCIASWPRHYFHCMDPARPTHRRPPGRDSRAH